MGPDFDKQNNIAVFKTVGKKLKSDEALFLFLYCPVIFSRVYDNQIQLPVQCSAPMLLSSSALVVSYCNCVIEMMSKARDVTKLIECLLI